MAGGGLAGVPRHRQRPGSDAVHSRRHAVARGAVARVRRAADEAICPTAVLLMEADAAAGRAADWFLRLAAAARDCRHRDRLVAGESLLAPWLGRRSRARS